MTKKDRMVLQKILQYCEDVAVLIERFGDSLSAYREDFAYQYATNMCIIQIGELVAQLSEEVKNQHGEIPWRLIKDMRNLFAHDYTRVDHEIVWETLKNSIPELEEKCIAILENG